MAFTERFAYLVEELTNGNMSEFSKRTGISYTSVNEHYKGIKTNPKISFLNKLINSFENINTEWLVTGKGQPFNVGVHNTRLSYKELKEGNQVNHKDLSNIQEENSGYNINECPLCVEKNKRLKDLSDIIKNLNTIIDDLKDDKAYLKKRLKIIENNSNGNKPENNDNSKAS